MFWLLESGEAICDCASSSRLDITRPCLAPLSLLSVVPYQIPRSSVLSLFSPASRLSSRFSCLSVVALDPCHQESTCALCFPHISHSRTRCILPWLCSIVSSLGAVSSGFVCCCPGHSPALDCVVDRERKETSRLGGHHGSLAAGYQQQLDRTHHSWHFILTNGQTAAPNDVLQCDTLDIDPKERLPGQQSHELFPSTHPPGPAFASRGRASKMHSSVHLQSAGGRGSDVTGPSSQ